MNAATEAATGTIESVFPALYQMNAVVSFCRHLGEA
jgi:hypothetical protein